VGLSSLFPTPFYENTKSRIARLLQMANVKDRIFQGRDVRQIRVELTNCQASVAGEVATASDTPSAWMSSIRWGPKAR
jgi:hypothetical protein